MDSSRKKGSKEEVRRSGLHISRRKKQTLMRALSGERRRLKVPIGTDLGKSLDLTTNEVLNNKKTSVHSKRASCLIFKLLKNEQGRGGGRRSLIFLRFTLLWNVLMYINRQLITIIMSKVKKRIYDGLNIQLVLVIHIVST